MGLKIGSLVKKVTPVFCDKLTVVLDYPGLAEREKFKSGMASLKGCFDFPSYNFKQRYRYGLKMNSGVHGVTTLIQWESLDKGTPYIRIDLNPQKLVMEDALATLSVILPGGLDYFSEHAKVTRLDATVDLVGILPSQLLAYCLAKQVSQLHCKSGKVETLYFGVRGENNHVVIYDKRKQVAEMNKKWGWSFPVPKQNITRVEVRMKPNATFEKLLGIANPFKALSFYELPLAEGGEAWRLFSVVAGIAGLPMAYQTLDEKTRPQFKARMEKCAAPWWNAGEIWKGWPDLVKSLGTGTVAINCGMDSDNN